MSFQEALSAKKVGILRAWYNSVLESFPQASRGMIGNTSDQFGSPMGHIFNDGLNQLFDHLLSEGDPADLEAALGQIVRLRAVQDKGASDGLGFLFALKKIIRDVTGAKKKNFDQYTELLEIEDRIDGWIEQAHRIYVDAREKISELKVNEMQNKTYMLRKLVGEV